MYPSPTLQHTTVSFDLAKAAEVTLEVYDVLGRLATRVEAGVVAASMNKRIEVPSFALGVGAYVYRLTAAGASSTEVASGRITVVR